MGILSKRLKDLADNMPLSTAETALISGIPTAITATAIRDGDATDKLKSALATTAGASAGGLATIPLLAKLNKANLLPKHPVAGSLTNRGLLASLAVSLAGATAGGTLGYKLEKDLSDNK